MKIAIIDNYDSFTYNLVHIVERFCGQVIVMRNDQINWDVLEECDKIIFSPGPGLPCEVKSMGQILTLYSQSKPILGVCLGMQFIAEYFGAKLINMQEIVHGVPRKTSITDSSDPIFKGVTEYFDSGRYHSWAVSPENFPNCLQITAVDENSTTMAIRHKQLNLWGVQFHPESIMTQYGATMLKNWILN